MAGLFDLVPEEFQIAHRLCLSKFKYVAEGQDQPSSAAFYEIAHPHCYLAALYQIHTAASYLKGFDPIDEQIINYVEDSLCASNDTLHLI